MDSLPEAFALGEVLMDSPSQSKSLSPFPRTLSKAILPVRIDWMLPMFCGFTLGPATAGFLLP